MKQRAAISGGIAVGIALVLALWPMSGLHEPPPAPVWVIANTWFGPLLILSIPVLAFWTSFGAETRESATLGIGISFALLVLWCW